MVGSSGVRMPWESPAEFPLHYSRMSSRPALGAALAAVLATQPACVEEIRERCPLVTDPRPAPALPRDFVQLDDLLRHRALQMVYDARQLHGSATTSFHIVFATETLPLWCDQIV